MDRSEALSVLDSALAGYRARAHRDLLPLLTRQDTFTVPGPSGTVYQLEIQAVWDGPRNGNLRVIGSIDDGGLRAFVPLTRDFVLSPDGQFVGE